MGIGVVGAVGVGVDQGLHGCWVNKFFTQEKCVLSVKMTGDEKATAVEKSQLVPVEKSQEEEKKPNAAPTE